MARDQGPYTSSLEHLYDELRRVELLVRAQVERWRRAIGEQRADTAWGTGILDPRELERYLTNDFVEPLMEPEHAEDEEKAPEQKHVARAFQQMIAIRERRERTGDDVPLRLEQLRSALALEQFDVDIILLCLLGELDGRYRRLFAYLADEPGVRSPSVGLLAEIRQPGPTALPEFRARFAPDRPLLAHQVVRLGGGPAAHDGLSTRSVVLDDRIVGFLTGTDELEGWLVDAVRLADPLAWDRLTLPDTRLAHLLVMANSCRPYGRPAATVALIGAEGSGRTSVARCLATQLGAPLMLVDVQVAVAHGTGFARHVYREARLRDTAVMWRGCGRLMDKEVDHERWWTDLLTAAAQHVQPTFVDHAQPWDPPDRPVGGGPFYRLPCPSPGLDERRALWSTILREAGWHADEMQPDVVAERLAGTFLLTPGRMHDAVTMAHELAQARDGVDAATTETDLDDACRRQSSRRMLHIARRVEAPAGMDLEDIVLPAQTLDQLVALRDRIANRNRVEQLLGPGRAGPKGLLAMFCGASGTGKTLAAGLLAKDLGRDLLKVDLSQVVSKWVGETEKNLDRVLRDVQEAHAILFFDEAEAIFGQRGTVTNAQDKYALQETSYLLQRIEEHEGVVILATNLRQHLDAAFSRRIQQVIEFPTPDDEGRRRIWRLSLSSVEHDLTERDIEQVATRSRFSAAAIVQVVLAATFAAVARDPESPTVTLADVDAAVRSELQRVGLPSTPTPRRAAVPG